MSLTIQPRHITRNRPGTALTPLGLVIHTTANPGVGDERHFEYWNAADRGSSAHLVVDWDSATELIPWRPGEAEMAWHAGPEANRRFLGLEICETDDPAQFERTWSNAVDVAVQVLQAHFWGPERLLPHAAVTWWFGGTDHADPLPWLARWGRTWGDLVHAVDLALRGLPAVSGLSEVITPTEDWQERAVAELTSIILPDGQPLLHELRPPRRAVEWWEMATLLRRLYDATRTH